MKKFPLNFMINFICGIASRTQHTARNNNNNNTKCETRKLFQQLDFHLLAKFRLRSAYVSSMVFIHFALNKSMRNILINAQHTK